MGNIRKEILVDGVTEKINGQAKFTDDIRIENTLYGKTLRSKIAYGKILNINYPELPEGYYIVDKSDIKNNNIVKIIGEDQPVFSDGIVNYIGEPIALFVGKDKKKLKELLNETIIEYERFIPILNIDDERTGEEKNIFSHFKLEQGDLLSAKSSSCFSLKKTFQTGIQEHVYLEPQSMLAEYKDDEVIIHGSLQSFYAVKEAVEFCTGYPVRIIQPPTGGGFGGKEDFPSLIACHAALGAIKCKGPVKVIYERSEDIICTTKRHPSYSTYEIFLDKNHKILGIEADLRLDAGAYEGLSSLVLELMMSTCCGIYNIPNLKVSAKAIRTNKLSFGAWRGFGAPQGDFCIETLLELTAKKLCISSLELRRKNLPSKGDHTATGGIYREDIFLESMLDEVLKKSDYINKTKMIIKNKSNTIRSIGLSFSHLGGGLNGNAEKDITKAKVSLKKTEDNRIIIFTSIVDIGQGAYSAFRKIVATTLDIPIERVVSHIPDSSICPDSGPTVASRSVLIVGKILERAAIKLRKKIDLPGEIIVSERYKHPEGFYWEDQKHSGDFKISNSFAINIIEIEIDLLTYRIYPIKYWGIYDIGTPINHNIALGQIHGGVVQGAGYSSMEVMKFDSVGSLLQKNLTDYLIPTSKDSFPMDVTFFDNFGKQGPLGAKALGELPFIGVAPAILSAVNRAFNSEITEIPLTPEFLTEVLDENNF